MAYYSLPDSLRAAKNSHYKAGTSPPQRLLTLETYRGDVYHECDRCGFAKAAIHRLDLNKAYGVKRCKSCDDQIAMQPRGWISLVAGVCLGDDGEFLLEGASPHE